MARQPAELATAEMAADDPAVLLYTSGTTGKPKGAVWTHVSFLGSMVMRDMHICADFKASDRFFFMSDMGWMVGAMCACIPSYFGGSLLVAGNQVITEETTSYVGSQDAAKTNNLTARRVLNGFDPVKVWDGFTTAANNATIKKSPIAPPRPKCDSMAAIPRPAAIPAKGPSQREAPLGFAAAAAGALR